MRKKFREREKKREERSLRIPQRRRKGGKKELKQKHKIHKSQTKGNKTKCKGMKRKERIILNKGTQRRMKWTAGFECKAISRVRGSFEQFMVHLCPSMVNQ